MSIHDHHHASALLPALNGKSHAANNGRGYEPSMDRIADLSKKATAAAETAATDFRSLGEEIMALAGHIKVQCENAAEDFEKVGGQIVNHVNNFAEQAMKAGTQAQEARDSFSKFGQQ